MHQYKNLIIIGTSHIAVQSLELVKKAIETAKPGIVCLELDRKRLHSLLQQSKKSKIKFSSVRRIGFKGFVFGMIGSYVQRKLGKIVGVNPGAEMLTAFNLAKKYKAKVALVDQDIEVTLRKFSNRLSWKERWHFVVDVFKSIFFRKSEMRKLGIVDLDLSKVPSKKVIKKLTGTLKKRYPNVYDVLIKQRNEYMAKNISEVIRTHASEVVVAVVGAGHEEELLKLIKKDYDKGITYSFNVK